jgi:hypothetical protein
MDRQLTPSEIGSRMVGLKYAKMTAEERSENARKAARARWGKKKKPKRRK